jgi:two-component system nitrogen regulation sensor histidine kinase NtrY
MVREILVLYEQAHKKIQFHFIEQDIPRFAFDPEQMKRVLVNLLDNAVAVLQEKGDIEIEVSADLNEKLVFLEVRDNGAGVADADKLRLFEPYFSTKKSGTGLGLAIASTVVADHGGYIRVKDNMPKGARFIVELPLVMEI